MVLYDMVIQIPSNSPLAKTNIAYEAAISYFNEFVRKLFVIATMKDLYLPPYILKMVLFDMEIYIPPISPLATTNIAYEAAISFFNEFVQKFAWFDMLI